MKTTYCECSCMTWRRRETMVRVKDQRLTGFGGGRETSTGGTQRNFRAVELSCTTLSGDDEWCSRPVSLLTSTQEDLRMAEWAASLPLPWEVSASPFSSANADVFWDCTVSCCMVIVGISPWWTEPFYQYLLLLDLTWTFSDSRAFPLCLGLLFVWNIFFHLLLSTSW